MSYFTLQEKLRSEILKLRNDLACLVMHIDDLKLKLNPIDAELERILKNVDELVELVKELKGHQFIKY